MVGRLDSAAFDLFGGRRLSAALPPPPASKFPLLHTAARNKYALCPHHHRAVPQCTLPRRRRDMFVDVHRGPKSGSIRSHTPSASSPRLSTSLSPLAQSPPLSGVCAFILSSAGLGLLWGSACRKSARSRTQRVAFPCRFWMGGICLARGARCHADCRGFLFFRRRYRCLKSGVRVDNACKDSVQ